MSVAHCKIQPFLVDPTSKLIAHVALVRRYMAANTEEAYDMQHADVLLEYVRAVEEICYSGSRLSMDGLWQTTSLQARLAHVT